MHSLVVQTFDEWRSIARSLLMARVPPDEVLFYDSPSEPTLFDEGRSDQSAGGLIAPQESAVVKVPASFLELARIVGFHRDPDRFQLLYRVLWRLTSNQPHLLDVVTDDDIHRLRQMEKAVLRDEHKMQAFVRFRKLVTGDSEQFVAWHRPDHRVLRLVAPFFSRRFPAMNWSILTPDESVWWDQQELRYGPGCSRENAPDADELEDLWRTYYGSIFNPARIKINAMIREMPIRHWATLPEATIINDLLNDAPRRVEEMIARQEGHPRSAADHIPAVVTLESLRTAAVGCRGCDLFQNATQTVFGEGPHDARIVFVGEQPGDQEDIAGRPFVGPAGQVLDDAIQQAGLNRGEIYLTNAVKHFKFEPTEKRRLHQKPSARESSACRPWVDAELKVIKPRILVCLGATAAQSLIGPGFSITRQRGQFVSSSRCDHTIATYHPSAILRSPQPEALRQSLIQDLLSAKTRLEWLEQGGDLHS